jgi:hypothetical protein
MLAVAVTALVGNRKDRVAFEGTSRFGNKGSREASIVSQERRASPSLMTNPKASFDYDLTCKPTRPLF